MPIVDTHQHLWDLTRFKLPWIQKDSPLARSFVMKDYSDGGGRPERRQGGVHGGGRRSDAATGRGGLRAPTFAGGAKTPTAAAVVSRPARLRPISPSISIASRATPTSRAFARCCTSRRRRPGFAWPPNFVRGIRLLGERGLSFDLCMRPAELRRRHQAGRSLPQHPLHPRPLRQRPTSRPRTGPNGSAT